MTTKTIKPMAEAAAIKSGRPDKYHRARVKAQEAEALIDRAMHLLDESVKIMQPDLEGTAWATDDLCGRVSDIEEMFFLLHDLVGSVSVDYVRQILANSTPRRRRQHTPEAWTVAKLSGLADRLAEHGLRGISKEAIEESGLTQLLCRAADVLEQLSEGDSTPAKIAAAWQDDMLLCGLRWVVDWFSKAPAELQAHFLCAVPEDRWPTKARHERWMESVCSMDLRTCEIVQAMLNRRLAKAADKSPLRLVGAGEEVEDAG